MNPRLVIAALRGGCGKTVFSIGLCSLWREKGGGVVPFKKGPDYIDAAWLSRAAGKPCRHLDPYLMTREEILGSYLRHTRKRQAAITIIEGNRGLYDGVDPEGSCSTAELAKVLRAPVIIVLDGTKTTRTAAAMVLGLRQLDHKVDIQGVVLNKVAGARHESILRRSIEEFAGVRVLGAMPRLHGLKFPERHLGLVPPEELDLQHELIREITSMIRGNVQTEKIWEIAAKAVDLPTVSLYRGKTFQEQGQRFRVGVIRDEAFHFYYPENLEALEERGAKVVPISALETSHLPDVDALYIGGGFPEMWAEGLAQNASIRREIRDAAKEGLPVYAECGGLMYLGDALRFRGRQYPMVGAIPLVSEFSERPQGHGYTTLEAAYNNPFFRRGTILKGHEFHYSKIVSMDETKISFAFRVLRGRGIDGEREGIVRKNVLASYTHIHALGCGAWGDGISFCSRHWRQGQQPGMVMGGGLI
jgi:cobyrinic acid a,c-diamide synthase